MSQRRPDDEIPHLAHRRRAAVRRDRGEALREGGPEGATALRDDGVDAPQPLEVVVGVVEEERVQDPAEQRRGRRRLGGGGQRRSHGPRLLPERDDEDPLRPEPDGGRERHVLAHRPVHEPGALDLDGPEQERDRARRERVLRPDVARPHLDERVPAPARERSARLDEHDRPPGAEVGRADGERVEVPLAEVAVEPVPVHPPLDDAGERLGPEEVRDPPRHLPQPGRAQLPKHVGGEPGEPERAPVEDVLEPERAPDLHERLALVLRTVRARREEAGVHRADRGAADEVDAGLGAERLRELAAEVADDPGLVRAARAAAGEDERGAARRPVRPRSQRDLLEVTRVGEEADGRHVPAILQSKCRRRAGALRPYRAGRERGGARER